jgi:hypothetical protein
LDARILTATLAMVIAPERHRRRLEKARQEARAVTAPASRTVDAPPVEVEASYANATTPLPNRPLSAQ